MIKLYAAPVTRWTCSTERCVVEPRDPGTRTPKHKVLGCDIAERVQAIGRNCNVSKRVEHKWKTLHGICSRSPAV